MMDTTFPEIDGAVRMAAREARLPEPTLGWEGRAWRWVWSSEAEGRVGELRAELSPPLGSEQESLLTSGSEFRVAALVWALDAPADVWARHYFVGHPRMVLSRAFGDSPESPDQSLLSFVLAAAWSEMQMRLREARLVTASRAELIEEFRRSLSGGGSG